MTETKNEKPGFEGGSCPVEMDLNWLLAPNVDGRSSVTTTIGLVLGVVTQGSLDIKALGLCTHTPSKVTIGSHDDVTTF